MVFLMGNYMAPWGIRFNPFMMAQSGKPYNIVTNNDLTGDNFFNNRPALADNSLCAGQSGRYASTTFGCLDTQHRPITIRRSRSMRAMDRRRWP